MQTKNTAGAVIASPHGDAVGPKKDIERMKGRESGRVGQARCEEKSLKEGL